MARLDAEIDQLYKLPLGDFTAERNALAKRAGAEGAAIRELQKPTVAAWAINQLYWNRRAVYDELMERAEDLRATHNAAIRGRRTDLRGANNAHEDAIEAALKATLALLVENGQPVTEATRQAIATTLRSLPGDEPAGRLSRQLQPRGFEMLAAASSQGRVHAAPPPAKRKPATAQARESDRNAAKIAAARDAVAAASRVTRDAEQVVRREEFEAARANRDVEKAERRVKEAQDTLRQAEDELADAKRAAATAAKASDLAQARVTKANDQLTQARDKEERSRSSLASLT